MDDRHPTSDAMEYLRQLGVESSDKEVAIFANLMQHYFQGFHALIESDRLGKENAALVKATCPSFSGNPNNLNISYDSPYYPAWTRINVPQYFYRRSWHNKMDNIHYFMHRKPYKELCIKTLPVHGDILDRLHDARIADSHLIDPFKHLSARYELESHPDYPKLYDVYLAMASVIRGIERMEFNSDIVFITEFKLLGYDKYK